MNNKGINRKVTIMEVFMEGVKLSNIIKKTHDSAVIHTLGKSKK